MEQEAPDAIEEYSLNPFEMKVQGIDRTLADKVFAVCDYYLQAKVAKHSRHLYDIYKLRCQAIIVLLICFFLYDFFK